MQISSKVDIMVRYSTRPKFDFFILICFHLEHIQFPFERFFANVTSSQNMDFLNRLNVKVFFEDGIFARP